VRRHSIRGVLQASINNSIVNETLGFSDTIGLMSSVINTTVAHLPFDADGKGRKVNDYLMESVAYKLRHFAYAVGLGKSYEAGSLDAADIELATDLAAESDASPARKPKLLDPLLAALFTEPVESATARVAEAANDLLQVGAWQVFLFGDVG
jgi:hypothetical protein